MKRWTAAIALALAAGAANARTLKVGDEAPDFRLKLVDGSTVSLAELRGQVVVLNFWATWCVPCRKELPLLDGYYCAQKPYGLRVFAVTTEDSVPTYRLKPLFGAMAIQPVRAVKGPYQVMSGVPTNYVIDRSGHADTRQRARSTSTRSTICLFRSCKSPLRPPVSAQARRRRAGSCPPSTPGTRRPRSRRR